MKKVFIISSVLLAVVLVFLGIYNFAFKKDVPLAKQQSNTAQPEKNASDAVALSMQNEKITQISDGPVIGPVVDKKTEEVKYYDANTGLVWQMDSDGKNKRRISETKVPGLKSIAWSPAHDKVLSVTEKDGTSSFYMYDYSAQKGTLLKNGLDTVVWDNLGTKIFYKYFDDSTKERTLNMANADGSGWQKIADMEFKNINMIAIPLTSMVSYWNTPNATEETRLNIVGATGGEPKIIFSGKYGADYLWSPKGDKAVVSALPSKDSRTIMLGLVDMDGKYQDLNIPTFASKCAWSEDGKTIYYALPGEIPSNALMPNDYQENKFNTNDTFWKMDVTTGEKERIIEVGDINGKYDSQSMFLSPTEDGIYFINRVDKKLYRIRF